MNTCFNLNQKIACFRQWSRKRYAAFSSLRLVVKICPLLAVYTLLNKPLSASAQSDTMSIPQKVDLDEVEIIGSRSPEVFSSIARIVTIVSSSEISSAPAQSLADLLEFALGVDIRQRGFMGVQGDVSIRGGTFDHVLIMLNGVNMTDPQTGHLNLDLPVDLEAIERIEVLNGPGARVYGANAFTGAVNIVTRSGEGMNLLVNQTYGDFNYLRTSVSAGAPLGNTSHQLSFSGSSADGYAPNTDFGQLMVNYTGTLSNKVDRLEWHAGFNAKEFGANSFYSPRFPEQYERGKLFYGAVKYATGTTIRFSPHIYWRRKTDNFILIKSNPRYYQNFHMTDVFGSQLNWCLRSGLGKSSFGTDLRTEHIVSNNLGHQVSNPLRVLNTDSAFYTRKYGRSYLGLFAEHKVIVGNLDITAGAMFHLNSDHPQKGDIFPGIEFSFRLDKNWQLISSYNRSMALPTFTDLFYVDPSNQGNPNLSPARLHAFETGMKYAGGPVSAGLFGFYHLANNVVDYLWSDQYSRYLAFNIPEIYTGGVEATASFRIPESYSYLLIQNVRINYSWLHIDKSLSGSVSKYYNLRHKLNLGINHRIFNRLLASWNIAYQHRLGDFITFDHEAMVFLTEPFTPYWLVDGKVHYQIRTVELFIEASNLLDIRYMDAGALHQPGRWVRGGFRLAVQ